MAHFSKYIRPGAKRIAIDTADNSLMLTAAKNPDGSIAVVIFNEAENAKDFSLSLYDKKIDVSISGQAIQTIIIPNS